MRNSKDFSQGSQLQVYLFLDEAHIYLSFFKQKDMIAVFQRSK